MCSRVYLKLYQRLVDIFSSRSTRFIVPTDLHYYKIMEFWNNIKL